MATNTYVALDKVTATAAANVSFTSIPATYTDLILVAVAKSSVTGSSVNNYRIRFNNDTTSVYSDTAIRGDGSTATSVRDSNQNEMYMAFLSQTSAQPETSIFHIMNYSNSTTNKTVLARGGSSSGGFVGAAVGLWRKTDAINRLDIYGPSGETVTGTFSLYGIASVGASPAPKATGGAIYSDDTYYYHVFGSTGTFTPLSSLSADVLVVAGGGGAGTNGSGGGGAGGLRLLASQSLTATGYTCTVGAGGAGIFLTTGSSGGASSFSSISTSGGGGGGGAGNGSANTGASGGSGGGSHRTASAGSGNTGSYSPVEGFAGATGASGGGSNGGGGGGAGAAGTAGTSSNGGAGGLGTSTYNSISFSSWLTATGLGIGGGLAGGGGGGGSTGFGTAVNGGGNGGLDNSAGTNATANTGGGGGGAGQSYGSAGGNGGSGVVIVRYLKA